MTNLNNQRLVSLDAFRGFTIIGMIIVNTPGSWSHVYGPLLHADWHGITPTDYVFPFFLFIVGISIALSYTKQLAAGKPKKALLTKLFKRAAIIFMLGVFLWIKGLLNYSDNYIFEIGQKTLILLLVCAFLFYSEKWQIQLVIAAILTIFCVLLFPENSLEKIRIPGVLQRIALVFFACALLFIYASWKAQLRVAILLLAGYWALMTLIPIPVDDVIQNALVSGQVKTSSGMLDIGKLSVLTEDLIAPNLEPGTNLQAWIDRQLIPGRMWQYTWDPEGVLSTLPSIATGILGMLIGHLIINEAKPYKKISFIFLFGILMYTMGGIWKWWFPFNKNLWTSSYVLHCAGLSALTLGAMMLLIDVLQIKNWAFPGLVFGSNSITAYVLSGLLLYIFYAGLNTSFIENMFSFGVPKKLSSFLYALFYVGIIFIPTYLLYKKRVFIRI